MHVVNYKETFLFLICDLLYYYRDEPLTSINIIEDEGDTLPDEWETDG